MLNPGAMNWTPAYGFNPALMGAMGAMNGQPLTDNWAAMALSAQAMPQPPPPSLFANAVQQPLLVPPAIPQQAAPSVELRPKPLIKKVSQVSAGGRVNLQTFLQEIATAKDTVNNSPMAQLESLVEAALVSVLA